MPGTTKSQPYLAFRTSNSSRFAKPYKVIDIDFKPRGSRPRWMFLFHILNTNIVANTTVNASKALDGARSSIYLLTVELEVYHLTFCSLLSANNC